MHQAHLSSSTFYQSKVHILFVINYDQALFCTISQTKHCKSKQPQLITTTYFNPHSLTLKGISIYFTVKLPNETYNALSYISEQTESPTLHRMMQFLITYSYSYHL